MIVNWLACWHHFLVKIFGPVPVSYTHLTSDTTQTTNTANIRADTQTTYGTKKRSNRATQSRKGIYYVLIL